MLRIAPIMVAACLALVAGAAAGEPDPVVGIWTLSGRSVAVVQTGPATFVGTRLFSIKQGPCTTLAGTKKWEVTRADDGSYSGTNHGVRWDSSDASSCRPLPIPTTITVGVETSGVLPLTACYAATDVTPAGCEVWTRRVTPAGPVPIESVSNGCGGTGWRSFERAQNYLGNTSVYRNSNVNPRAEPYKVDFRLACNLHDAGYAGAVVRDNLRGGVKDFRRWSRKQVDDKFLADMRLLCRRQLPPAATVALANCKGKGGRFSVGALSRHAFVRSVGSSFFDADLTKPGTQGEGERRND